MTKLSPNLKQFVPSHICLKCEGCCRFQTQDSIWRPKWNKKDFIDEGHYVTTIADCGKHYCRFFNSSDSTCRTYHDRPFECSLYPFLLSRTSAGVDLYVHLACPYIQDTQGNPEVEEYTAYLKEFFRQPGTRDFLCRNTHLIHDYTPVHNELQFLFTIGDLNADQELLNKKALFDDYSARGERPLSTYHFSSIFGWNNYFRFRFEIIEERLCIFAFQGPDSFLYLPPLGGKITKSCLDSCFERMGKSRIARIENFHDIHLNNLGAHAYNVHTKAHEYVYERQKLVDLSGHDYKSRRHDIHVFEKKFPNAVFRPYRDADLSACQALYAQWADNRRSRSQDNVYTAMLDENEGVHSLFLSYAQALGLIGRVVEIDGFIAAYTFGYELDQHTFCVLLEVTDLSKAGLAAFVFNKFCQDQDVVRYSLINAMDDFGIPEVAAVKNSYHPYKRLPILTVTQCT